MNKIKEIVLAWAASMNPTEEQKKVAEIRLETCMNCDQWDTNVAGVNYCKQCGCATRAKVFSPKGLEACPLKKWSI